MTTDFTTMLKAAKLPERCLPVCLRGDLVADHEAAELELERARRNPSTGMEDDGVNALVDRIEALQAEMREHTYPFRLRAMPKPKFQALVAAHPPRRGEDGDPLPEDAGIGLNKGTFFHHLIRACTVDPLLDDDQWRELLGDDDDERAWREAAGEPVEDGALTDRQFGDLEDAAWFLNRGKINVPFSRAASLAKRDIASE